MTPRCAVDLGYNLSDEDKLRPFIEVSGRKGYGVKADDLLDKLTAAAQAEVDTRHPELSGDGADDDCDSDCCWRAALLHAAVHAQYGDRVRLQRRAELRGRDRPLHPGYAIVRASNIFRKAGTTEEAALAAIADLDLSDAEHGEDGTSLWETWLLASRLTALIEQAIATAEPAYLARVWISAGYSSSTTSITGITS